MRHRTFRTGLTRSAVFTPSTNSTTAAHASGGIRARAEDGRGGGASRAIVVVASTCGEYSCVRGDPPRGVDQ